MDEALKARLVGATVLVALAVLFIPELLSGRKPETSAGPQAAGTRSTRTFTIELAGGSPESGAAKPAMAPPASSSASADQAWASAGSTAGAPPQGGALAAHPAAAQQPTEVAAPPSQATSSAAQLPPAQRTATAATPGAKPPAAETRAAEAPTMAIPARGGWAVQVGAFGARATAEKLMAELQSAGYKTYLSPVSRAGKTLYRVRVGPEPERARADGLAASLKGRGLPTTVVAND